MTIQFAPIREAIQPMPPAWSIWFQTTVTAINGKEDSLGKPAVDGYILASLADGTRYWTALDLGGA